MEKSPFLPLPEGLLIEQVHQTESQLTVIVISTRASASCPGCGCPSEQIHSQYQRTVIDSWPILKWYPKWIRHSEHSRERVLLVQLRGAKSPLE
jgi:transposase